MNEIANINHGTTVAVPQNYDPYAAYAKESQTSRIIGTILKFSKGEWCFGKNDTVVPVGTTLAVDMGSLQVGWIRWEAKKPVEIRMGYVADAYRPEGRDALGYNDKSQWERDDRDVPQDPWQQTSSVIMVDEDRRVFTFQPASYGGRKALIDLAGAYGRDRREHPGQCPLVQIGVDSYKHERYGKVYEPTIRIFDWMSEADVVSMIEREKTETAAEERAQAEQPKEIARHQTTHKQEAPAERKSGFSFAKPADAEGGTAASAGTRF